MSAMIKIKWLGHSCFRLEYEGATVVIDPYDHVQGYPELKVTADAVLTSHEHGDHGYVQAVELTGEGKKLPFTFEVVETFHDDAFGAKRGHNRVNIVSADGLRVAHLGDLGHQLSKEQIDAIGACDAVMTPVGGFYTVDAPGAKSVCDALNPRVIIPMHYHRGQLGFDVIGGVEEFTALYPRDCVREIGVDTLELTPHTPHQVAVLTFGK